METEKTVAPTQSAGAVTPSLNHQSEKDMSTHESGSTYDELRVSNGKATDAQEETAPQEVLLEQHGELDGRKKAIIVLALCVGFFIFIVVVGIS